MYVQFSVTVKLSSSIHNKNISHTHYAVFPDSEPIFSSHILCVAVNLYGFMTKELVFNYAIAYFFHIS